MEVRNTDPAAEMKNQAVSSHSQIEEKFGFGLSDDGSGDQKLETSAQSLSQQSPPAGDRSDLVTPDDRDIADVGKQDVQTSAKDIAMDKSNSEPTTTEQQNVGSNTVQTEAGTQKSETVSDKQNVDSDTRQEMMAASAKEEDVRDECLTSSTAEEEDGWMDILGSGQLKKKVLKAGTESSRPVQGDLVKVKVTGNLKSGATVYDATETFILGDGDVIAAIDMSIALMNQGEIAEVFTAARFAFGSKGRDQDIPGDSPLTLTLELQDVQPGPDVNKLTAEERLSFGERKRERGNELFHREDFSGAINSYSKAVKFLDAGSGGLSGEPSLLQKLLDSRIKCYNNMAASQLKIGASDAAIRSCAEVLKSQPENVKALYRQGKAYGAKGNTEKALSLLKKAISLDPQSKLLEREFTLLSQKRKKEMESERSMYKKMLGNMADAGAEDKNDKSSSTWKWPLIVGGVVAATVSLGVAYFRSTH